MRLWRYWLSFYRPLRRFTQATPYLWSVRGNPELQAVCRAYTHWLPLNLYIEPMGWLRALLGARNRFRAQGQRPYDIYVPHLEALPFHPASPTTEALELAWDDIRREYLQVCEQQGPPPNAAHVASGRWGTFDMVRQGEENPALAEQCPVTLATVRTLPLMDMVTFSTLAPGTRLRPHHGPTNVKLRHQLCLENAAGASIRVGDQWREWQQGKCLVIDDSFNHEVVHEGQARRVVMLVDCWHPQLTTSERDFLDHLYGIWGSKAN